MIMLHEDPEFLILFLTAAVPLTTTENDYLRFLIIPLTVS